jgi:hypothetical protein
MLFTFGILAAPILCRLLSDAWDRYEPERDLPIPNAFIMGIAAAALFFGFPGVADLEQQVQKANPLKALEFIKHARLTGPMLNDYVYGGYLIWAAPEKKVFVDGRAEIYEPAGVLKEYGRWATLQADPKALLDEYRITVCLLPRESPMNRVLPLVPGWSKVYSDSLVSVFKRSAKGS